MGSQQSSRKSFMICCGHATDTPGALTSHEYSLHPDDLPQSDSSDVGKGSPIQHHHAAVSSGECMASGQGSRRGNVATTCDCHAHEGSSAVENDQQVGASTPSSSSPSSPDRGSSVHNSSSVVDDQSRMPQQHSPPSSHSLQSRLSDPPTLEPPTLDFAAAKSSSGNVTAFGIHKQLKSLNWSKSQDHSWLGEEGLEDCVFSPRTESRHASVVLQNVPELSCVKPIGAPWSPQRMALCCLRARKFDVNRATQLARTLPKLHEDLLEGKAVNAATLWHHLATGTVQSNGGRDRAGRACIVLNIRRHDPQKYSAFQVTQLVTYVLEKTLRAGEEGAGGQPGVESEEARMTQVYGMCILADLSGVAMSNIDMRVPKLLYALFSSRIPMRLGSVYIVNPPWFFEVFFPAVRILMPEKIRRRIHVLGTQMQRLKDYFDDSHLLEEHGGSLVYDHRAWMNRMAEADGVEADRGG